MQYGPNLASYQEDGYVLVKGLLTKEEAAIYRDESHNIIERLNRGADSTWGSAKDLARAIASRDMGANNGVTGRTTLKHCHDVQFYSATFSRLIVDPRFTDIAAALIGSPNVQLHHTKMFIKPPEKGSPFPMHQDYPFFPHAKHTMMAAIFHLDDAPEEKGCVRVVPGSHKRGPLPHVAEGSWHLPFDDWPLDQAVPCEAEVGDVLFFPYLTVHGSGINRSSEPRTTLLVQVRDPSDTPTKDVHTGSLGQGMMLRGNWQGAN